MMRPDDLPGAGVSLSSLIREAAALNLGGLEALVGIPATVGGALAMNAGTLEGCIGDFVSAVYYLHPDGSLGEFKPGSGMSFKSFNAPPRSVLIGCRLQLYRRPLPDIQKDIKARLKVKKSTQPLALASAVRSLVKRSRVWPSARTTVTIRTGCA